MSDLVPTGSKYTDEDRRNAAMQYAITGKLTAVEQATGIPDATVQSWTKADWWEDLLQQARAVMEDEFRGKCHQVVEKATQVTLDRLENGDSVATKDGIKQIPMKGRDAAVIGAMYYDKLRLSLNLPTSISAGSGYKNAMESLAQEFKRLSESYQKKDMGVVSVQSGDSGISTAPDPSQ